MSRQDWKFTFTSAEVLEHARRKAVHHGNRIAHWTKEWEQASAQLSAANRNNLEAETSAMEQPPGTTYMAGHNMSLEQRAASERVNAAKTKLTTHRSQLDEVRRYVRALELDHDGTVELDVDDIAYFRL